MIRKHAQVVYACAGGKEDISRYWSIPEVDKKVRTKAPSRDMIKKIMADARRQENERRLLNNQLNLTNGNR